MPNFDNVSPMSSESETKSEIEQILISEELLIKHAVRCENEDGQVVYYAYGKNLKRLLSEAGLIDNVASTVARLTGGSDFDGNIFQPSLPNLLPQNAQNIKDQINKNLSIMTFVPSEDEEYYFCRHFATLYEYELPENPATSMAELGTVVTLYGDYSRDVAGRSQTKYPKAAHLLYQGAVNMATEQRIVLVETTTALVPIFLAAKAGFKFVTREQLAEIMEGMDIVLREVCVCPKSKTGSNKDNNDCRCAEVYNNILKGHTISNGYPPCAIRVYVPEEHHLRPWFNNIISPSITAERYPSIYQKVVTQEH
ncbi:MAG: hypothetical protein KatS3mg085_260 [Candidatus Dojkabacteria bacterium]|nr:MAG: hypothetical protein KatS3mg085_260 [Candidatus Dojkabacteria bacterium]